MQSGMSPSQVTGESREAEGEGTANKRNIVPLMGLSFDRGNDYEGQGGSSGNLGADLISDRDLCGLNTGRRQFDTL